MRTRLDRTQLLSCPLCGAVPRYGYVHVAGTAPRFEISCRRYSPATSRHELSVSGRVQRETVKQWNRLARRFSDA